MTIEQFEKAENLMRQYADVLDRIQRIRNDYVEKGDPDVRNCLNDCYFKLKEIFDQKLKEI
jgi:hypothetical protein